MDKMTELINALNALTKALQAFTATITNDNRDTMENINAPKKDDSREEVSKTQSTPEPEKPVVTFAQLHSRLSEISRKGHTAEIKALVAKYGADKLSKLEESNYAALLMEAEELV